MPPSISARTLATVAATLTAAILSVAVGGPAAAAAQGLAAAPGVASAQRLTAAVAPVDRTSPDALDSVAGELVAPAPAPAAAAPAPVAVEAAVPLQALAASHPAPVSAAPIVPPVPSPPAPPVPLLRNLLVSADGSLRTAVGVYSDCSGDTPLTHTIAAIDTCVAGPTYFVGHNYGVFTPLMSMSVGDLITWYDRNGVAHPMRIASIRDGWPSAEGAPRATQQGVVAQFQTCETYSPSGQYDRIVDTVSA